MSTLNAKDAAELKRLRERLNDVADDLVNYAMGPKAEEANYAAHDLRKAAETLREIDRLRAENHEAVAIICALYSWEPLPNGEWPHSIVCSGDRRFPPGEPGHSCSCRLAGRERAIAAEQKNTKHMAMIVDLGSKLERAREALREIAKGTGAHSRDPLTHAENVIDHCVETAGRALADTDPAASEDDLECACAIPIYVNGACCNCGGRWHKSRPPTSEPCTWTPDEGGNYESTCGRIFTLIDGGPAWNHMAFCCYCGRRLVEAASEGGDDE